MKYPKISVIVPVYKAERFIHKCLDSILAQTHTNLEIILVDDGSPDDCGRICDEYAGRDGRIRVIHQENGGVSSARNAGLRIATGDWVGFLDDDDWIEPDMFAYLLRLAQTHGADVAHCGLFFDEAGSSEEMFCAERERLIAGGAENFSAEDWQQIGNSNCNKLYRAACLNGIYYDTTCPMGEDLLFNLQALQQVSGVALGTEAKYHYVQHEDSACHMPPNVAYIRSHRQVLTSAMELFAEGSGPYIYFGAERLRMDMHNCSRIVRFPEMELSELKKEIRRDLRRETPRILRMQGISLKERGKLLLIAWNWWLYRILLLESKK